MDPERYTVVGQLPSRMEKLDRLGYSKHDAQLYEERTELFLTNSNRTRSRDEHCPTLVSYKVYNTADNTLLSETTDTTYTHTGLDPAMDYCYSVSAVYEAGVGRNRSCMQHSLCSRFKRRITICCGHVERG